MPFTTAFRNSLLDLIFLATGIPDIADNDATSPLTDWRVSLHTDAPGLGGAQNTNEAAYTGYGRVLVPRTGSGWSRSGNIISPVNPIEFGECTASPGSPLSWMGLGHATSGAGTLDMYGVIGSILGAFTATNGDENIRIPNLTGVAVNDRIAFLSAPGYVLPTGITENTLYHVISVTGTVIQVSTTQGGATINITADGAGIAFKATPITMAVQTVPRIKTTTQILLM